MIAKSGSFNELDENQDLKAQFADALLRSPQNPYEAAQKLGLDQASTMHISANWPFRKDVCELKERLLHEFGAREFLPTKEEAARMIYDKAQQARKPDDFVKLMKLYGDYMGMIEKPGVTINNNNLIQPNVMAVPLVANLEEWATVASQQQAKLIDLAAKNETDIVDGEVA